jgi:KDO2-lipid IV(A) lauroyltransferase
LKATITTLKLDPSLELTPLPKKIRLKGCLGALAFVFRALPLQTSLWMGRCLGHVGYYLLPKKRAVVYANLKTVFREKTPQQLRALTRLVFINLTQSFVELLCMPTLKRIGFEHFVQLRGKENIDQAMLENKGVIFLAMHSGNWELGSVFNSFTGYTYHVVANEQPKTPELGRLLNECRQMAGAHIISAGVATKEIIKALKRNEIVGLLLDQGGKEGTPVNFLGKTASMSSGAIRLALKYGCPICPAWIERQANGTHVLEFLPPFSVVKTEDLEKDIQFNLQAVTNQFETLLRRHPQEYLWFYKVFKYTTEAQVVILDDKDQQHLQRAKMSSNELKTLLEKEGKCVKEEIIPLEFHHPRLVGMFYVYVFLCRFVEVLRNENHLKAFFTEACYNELMSIKADVVISCGEKSQGLNFILSKNHQAKSIVL